MTLPPVADRGGAPPARRRAGASLRLGLADTRHGGRRPLALRLPLNTPGGVVSGRHPTAGAAAHGCRRGRNSRRGLVLSTVLLVARKSRTLKLLAFDEKSTFDFFALFPHICIRRGSLYGYAEIKQKSQKWIFH
jgi:hypothetical protein